MAAPLLISPIFADFILPFVLVFTLIFAVLQRTQLLGEGKKQIDAMIALVVGLILIAFPFARNIVVTLMPLLAVLAVIILVFMLLYGFASGKKDSDILNKQMKTLIGIIVAAGIIGVILYSTGWGAALWNYIYYGGNGRMIFVNVLLVLVIAVAIIAVVRDKGGKSAGT
jgi:hypothetical protein